MMSRYSELDMANAFFYAIKCDEISRLPTFKYIFREVLCQQGIADFICLNDHGILGDYSFRNISSVENCVQVLTLLKLNSGRKLDYIYKNCSISKVALEKTLKEMLNNGYIKNDGELFYRSIPDISEINIWAFELKLNNWKRAVFQSLQYKLVANYSISVFPIEKKSLLLSNLSYFQQLNIGVLLFDINSRHHEWLNFPKKEKPHSQWDAFFTLSKLISQKTNTDEMN